jgi:hypothetical protein
MEKTETERKKIELKHGNGIFEHGTIKKRNIYNAETERSARNYFLTFFHKKNKILFD